MPQKAHLTATWIIFPKPELGAPLLVFRSWLPFSDRFPATHSLATFPFTRTGRGERRWDILMPLSPSRAEECEGRHGNRCLKSETVQKSLCPSFGMSPREAWLSALVWGFFSAEGAVREHPMCCDGLCSSRGTVHVGCGVEGAPWG